MRLAEFHPVPIVPDFAGMEISSLAPPPRTESLDGLARLIVESHLRVVGRLLIPNPPAHEVELGEALWTAPRAVVAHGTQADPVFCYGNRMALELFEMDFAAFTTLPSRCSAEPVAREERAALLERVTRDGYIDDYAGIRISSSGRRFRIENATVWNLIDADGVYRGQAATFSEWEPA
jgi:hypothetical protein